MAFRAITRLPGSVLATFMAGNKREFCQNPSFPFSRSFPLEREERHALCKNDAPDCLGGPMVTILDAYVVKCYTGPAKHKSSRTRRRLLKLRRSMSTVLVVVAYDILRQSQKDDQQMKRTSVVQGQVYVHGISIQRLSSHKYLLYSSPLSSWPAKKHASITSPLHSLSCKNSTTALRNSSGFSLMIQCPPSISLISNLGKNLPIIGSVSSAT